MIQYIMRFNRQVTTILSMLLVIFSSQFFTQNVHAQDPSQAEVDESFDPFADYNEYEQQTEEEEDINFLRNGRYLTLAFIGGYRGFVGGGLAEAYRANLTYGAEFTYFFNMQLAGSLSYMISDHNVGFASYTNLNFTNVANVYNGSVNLQNIDFHMKFYFNTDNVTKGLADLNPYGLAGGTFNTRTYNLDETLSSGSDQVWGFKMGAGIEIPLLKRKAYMGLQATYRYVQFPDENKGFIEESDSVTRPVKPRLDGDIYDLTVLLGLNF